MIQRLAHWLSGIGLHWFYSDIRIAGLERVPLEGPILVAMNHQNALVDAMLALLVVPRGLRITAKATLGDSIAGTMLIKATGIIPLIRTSDGPAGSDPLRNRHSFEAIIDELRRGGAVLVFPEGRSHNDPTLAPLKTGLARVALRARESGVHGIRIVPIGATYEDKAEPDTAVLAQIGEPIAVDDWVGDARELTDTITARLRPLSFTGDLTTPSDTAPAKQNILIRLAARWGRAMHEIPLRAARHQAVGFSEDVDESAMYTMTFGLVAILLSYIIEVSIVWTALGWMIAVAFLALLVTGAYYAAYTGHFPNRRAE